MKAPVDVIDREFQIRRVVLGKWVFDQFAGDAETSGTDDATAFLAAAESLALEDAFDFHGRFFFMGE